MYLSKYLKLNCLKWLGIAHFIYVHFLKRGDPTNGGVMFLTYHPVSRKN